MSRHVDKSGRCVSSMRFERLPISPVCSIPHRMSPAPFWRAFNGASWHVLLAVIMRCLSYNYHCHLNLGVEPALDCFAGAYNAQHTHATSAPHRQQRRQHETGPLR